jgi:hypothetical protein
MPPHERSSVTIRHVIIANWLKKCVHERIDPTESEHDGTQVLHSCKSFNDSSTLQLEFLDICNKWHLKQCELLQLPNQCLQIFFIGC